MRTQSQVAGVRGPMRGFWRMRFSLDPLAQPLQLVEASASGEWAHDCVPLGGVCGPPNQMLPTEHFAQRWAPGPAHRCHFSLLHLCGVPRFGTLSSRSWTSEYYEGVAMNLLVSTCPFGWYFHHFLQVGASGTTAGAKAEMPAVPCIRMAHVILRAQAGSVRMHGWGTGCREGAGPSQAA